MTRLTYGGEDVVSFAVLSGLTTPSHQMLILILPNSCLCTFRWNK